MHSNIIDVISSIMGWIYFAAWSVSFYPQIFINFKRKSVVGLNFDFLALNIMGFTLYSLFNCGLFFSKAIQTEYFERHPRGHNPVLLNDVFFSLHAAFATLVTITQCFLYEFERHPRGHNPVLLNDVFFSLHAAFATLVTITQCFLYEFERHPRGHNPVLLNDVFFSLHAAFATLVTITQCFLYEFERHPRGHNPVLLNDVFFSLHAAFATLVTITQCFLYEVTRWSIGNIFLDFVGGFLSVLQMMLNAYNYDDWASFFGDFTKFGLGAFSLIFDIFFILQHYVFYREGKDFMMVKSSDESSDMTSSGEGSEFFLLVDDWNADGKTKYNLDGKV
ncbi:Cystinosin [Operophtera brumata]|uniref:Cystinosin n=1 Tax=Operophtera brumata TaxID=104452 RepID=A0A0L7L8F1_OPEBR|nr:Cystinosin [Operophtera brumata]